MKDTKTAETRCHNVMRGKPIGAIGLDYRQPEKVSTMTMEGRASSPVQVERKGASSRGILYCDVSVNVTTGCPSPYGPSAVTCTAPALAGKVSTTEATPEVFVVTSRLDSVPESVVKNMSAPLPRFHPISLALK